MWTKKKAEAGTHPEEKVNKMGLNSEQHKYIWHIQSSFSTWPPKAIVGLSSLSHPLTNFVVAMF